MTASKTTLTPHANGLIVMTKENVNSAESFAQRLKALAVAWLTPKQSTMSDELSDVAPILQLGRERIIFAMVRVISACGVALWGLYFASSFINNKASVTAFGILMLLFVVLSHEKISYRTRCIGTGFCIYLAGVADLVFYGVWFAGPLFLLILVVYTLIFAGTRIGLAVIALAATTISSVAMLIALGLYTPPLNYFIPAANSTINALMWPAIFGLTALLAMVITNSLLQFVHGAWARERETTRELIQKSEQLNVSLEREQDLAAALQVSLNKEISLNHLRSQVITTISHEFRTPLTVINTSADLLQNYADRLTESKRSKQLTRIKSSVGKLDHLLGQVTAIEQVESTSRDDFVSLPFTEFSAELAQFIHEQFGQTESIHIEYDSADTAPITIERTRINQLCQVIVSNAVKFGSTSVSVEIQRQSDQLIITVEDNGVGIPEGEIAGLFSPFQRGSNAHDFQGLGIGLAIAKNLIKALKGSIKIESDETTIATLNIPIELSESEKKDAVILAATSSN